VHPRLQLPSTLLGATLLALLAAAACRTPADPSASATAPRPPIFVISIDTLRSDRLPAWSGRTDLATPAIDRLVRDGLVFERAFAEVPLTLPSHASLLTGLLPPAHGVRDNIGFAVDAARTPLLPARLQALGYTTGAAVSAEVLAKRTGIAAGFDFFDEPQPFAAGGSGKSASARTAERSGGAAVDAALRFLDGAAGRPVFFLLHLYEPHAPYRPVEPYRSRYADPYDGEIATADALVGRFLAELDRRGLYDGAVVVLLSDHGEGLGDHGEDEHGLLLYRESIQVPLAVKLPGRARAGERVHRNVGLIDVVPTVLELLRAPGGETLPGISLLAPEEAAGGPLRTIYSETMYPLIHFGWSELASMVSGDLHLIEGKRPELFDLARDPGERTDRTSDERRALAALRRALAAIDRTLVPPAPADAETVAALGALGYLGTPSTAPQGAATADPRDEVRKIAPVLRGLRHFNEGEYTEAIAVLAPAARAGEGSALAWQYLGAAYDALGRKDDALAAYRNGMRLAGSPAYLAETAALRLLELGRPQAAADLLAGELERLRQGTAGGEDARLRVLLSRALLQVGRIDDAARAADEAVQRGGRLADAFYQRAVVALARRDGPAAIDDLVTATALDARHLEARKALAMLRHAQGDDGEARRLLEEVLAIDPDDRDAREDLATLSASTGGAGPR